MRQDPSGFPRIHRAALTVSASILVAFATGCGGSAKTNFISPPPTESTPVTLMISSTANDQLQAFDLQFESLTLTSNSGNTVNVFSTPPYANLAEFIHLNGFSEPLLTVSVPQGTYTSAAATVGSAQFTCVQLDESQNSIYNSTFAYGATPANQVTVNVPQPIDVNSVAMGLSLNLQVSPSATYGSCIVNGTPQYSINPTFDLNPIVYGNPNNNVLSVQATTLRGIVDSVDSAAGTLTAATADGLTLDVTTSANTTFQNLSGLGALSAGAAVEMDLQLGEDGSVQATRIQSLDSSPTNLSVITGPIESVSSALPVASISDTEQQGFLPGGTPILNFGNATFQISGYLSNLAQMPFTPTFNAATVVAGQQVAFTTHATTLQGGPTYVPATTVTLVPQTVNGIVTSGSGSSALTAYTVSLAPYDLFPDLAVQAGQSTLLTSPSIVMVYTLGGANGVQATVGNPFRFTGLVFNDNGSLKMDCLQILAGVPE
jgi:hypothetical protein